MVEEQDGAKHQSWDDGKNESSKHPRVIGRDPGIDEIDEWRDDGEKGDQQFPFFLQEEINYSKYSKEERAG